MCREKTCVQNAYLLALNKKGKFESRPLHYIFTNLYKYLKHGGWTGRTIEELTGVPKGMGMGRAVEMIADIYQSNDVELIDITFRTLEIFRNSTFKTKDGD